VALDSAVSELLTELILTGSKEKSDRMSVIGDNLAQGLGVINSTLIQQHGGAADDAATMAALRTAVHVPTKE